MSDIDPIHEGIALAVSAVRDLKNDWGMEPRAAILEAIRTLDLPEGDEDAWIMSPYGPLEEAVRDAAYSQLRDMLAATPENPHIGSSLDDLLDEDAK